MNNKITLWAVGIGGVSIIIGTSIIATTLYNIKGAENSISVTGSSSQTITSDVVEWQGGFSRNVTPDNLTQGYAQMKSDLAIVMKYLGDNGVKDSEVTVTPISVMPNYSSDSSYYGKGGGSAIIGYQLSQSFTVQSNDVDGITQVAKDSGAIINEGVIFSGQAPQYFYSKLSELKLDMLADATKDAEGRAERIAESAGSKVDHLQSASMGVFQITPVNSTDLSDYGEYDTTSIVKQITAIVHASFGLK